MEFSINKENGAIVLALKGSLLADVQSKDILQNVSEAIQEGDVKIAVDMHELKFINSSGLGMLLTLMMKARKSGGDVVLVNTPEQVINLLAITKLTGSFRLFESLPEAISAL